MEKMGVITATGKGLLDVTFCAVKDCGACHACDGGQKQTVVQVQGEASVGDYAVVDLPASTVVKASLLAYVLPIVGLLGGMAIGNQLSSSPAAAALGGGIGLIATLSAVWITEKHRQRSAKWHPTLVRIIPSDSRDVSEEDKQA